jgi:SOS-response transcriptional repressor LexA
MKPKVNDGDLVTLQPAQADDLVVGDIVLVRVSGSDYLHLVKAIDGSRFQIGNNRGRINGWVGRNAIYGRAIKVEPT